MSHWTPADWATFFAVATPFAAGIFAGLLTLIKATRENTRVTVENTIDRAVKATTSNVQLAAIADTVGAPVTVPQPERAAVAVVAPSPAPPTAPPQPPAND